jgi:hypothetical protein
MRSRLRNLVFTKLWFALMAQSLAALRAPSLIVMFPIVRG